MAHGVSPDVEQQEGDQQPPNGSRIGNHSKIGVVSLPSNPGSHETREPMAGMLQGVVEADETYVGGKPRPHSGKPRKRGRGTAKKPVMVLVERDGSAHAFPVDLVDGKPLKGQIAVNVAKEAIVMTDEFSAYSGLDSQVARHETVNHSAGQYARC